MVVVERKGFGSQGVVGRKEVLAQLDVDQLHQGILVQHQPRRFQVMCQVSDLHQVFESLAEKVKETFHGWKEKSGWRR